MNDHWQKLLEGRMYEAQICWPEPSLSLDFEVRPGGDRVATRGDVGGGIRSCHLFVGCTDAYGGRRAHDEGHVVYPDGVEG